MNNISNNSVIDNSIETDGSAPSNDADGRGAGMFLFTPSGGSKDRQIIINVFENIISDNFASGNSVFGGGIYTHALGDSESTKGKIVLTKNIITHNILQGSVSSDGGGIYSYTKDYGETVIADDNVVQDNEPNNIGSNR